MSSVVLIGAEGSGKTVLLATLDKFFGPGNALPNGGTSSVQAAPLTVVWRPADKQTAEYVSSAQSKLLNGAWPAPTLPAAPRELNWKLRLSDEVERDLQVLDCSGQDWRSTLDGNHLRDSAPGKHPLVDAVRQAKLVVLMVNLEDFVGEQNAARKLASEWLVLEGLRLVYSQGQKRAILLISKQDRFAYLLQEHQDWSQVLAKYLPLVSAEFLVNSKVAVRAISAVSNTIAAANGDGRPQRVPDRRSLKCRGLNHVVGAIVESLDAPQQVSTDADFETIAKNVVDAVWTPLSDSQRENVIGWIVGIVIFAVVIGLVIFF